MFIDRLSLVEDQLARLRRLIDELLASNPFYGRKLIKAGVTDSSCISRLDDLSRLPATTRQELTEDQAVAPPFGTNLSYDFDRYLRWHRTSGTQGRPLHWLDTKESWDWVIACWRSVLDAAGVTSRDRIFFPFSFGPFLGFWAGWDVAAQVGALSFSGANQTSLQRLKTIIEFMPTVVCATPTYAIHLAEIAEQEGIDLANSKVEKLIVAGEPGGSVPETRELMERRWGAVVFDHAGATEVGPHSFSCSEGCALHLNEAEFIAEVWPEDPAETAKRGELVLTNLGRLGSPVIEISHGRLGRDRRRPMPMRAPIHTAGRRDSRTAGRYDHDPRRQRLPQRHRGDAATLRGGDGVPHRGLSRPVARRDSRLSGGRLGSDPSEDPARTGQHLRPQDPGQGCAAQFLTAL